MRDVCWENAAQHASERPTTSAVSCSSGGMLWKQILVISMHTRTSARPRIARVTARLSQPYPPIARYGVFLCLNMANWVRYPLPFSERFPRGEHTKWRCETPPPKRGISAILSRYPMQTRQMGAIHPSAILSQTGVARYGGVSRTGPLSAHFCEGLRALWRRVAGEYADADCRFHWQGGSIVCCMFGKHRHMFCMYGCVIHTIHHNTITYKRKGLTE